MKTNSANGQLTAQINLGDHKKSGFDLSNNFLATGKIGRIIPTRALHVMPGDTIKSNSKVAVQFEPLAVPILSNMDVKQEHFYVPYNVVWQNWDKFISGGEKLDYEGKVPSVSMASIFNALMYYLKFDFGFISRRGIASSTSYQPLILANNIDYLDNKGDSLDYYLDSLDNIGTTFGVKDIIAPIKKQFSDFLTTLYKNEREMFICAYDIAGFETAADNFDRWWDYYCSIDDNLYGNKYLEKIKPYIKELVNSGETNFYLPLNYGIKFMLGTYEIIKPFVGYSSTIDYLNMGRISRSDWFMLVLKYFKANFTDNDSVFQVVFNPTSDIALSTQPLSILNLRANYCVWYNNYRDILLETGALEPRTTDAIYSQEIMNLIIPRYRCWQKDAFTTALDNPGTGNVGVPVMRDSGVGSMMNISKKMNDLPLLANQNDLELVEVSYAGKKWKLPTSFLSGINSISNENQNVSGFSLQALETAQRAQKFLQKALFFGNRISDFYYMRYGVKFLDSRLRLPELLASSSELVKLDVVMNNTNITTEVQGQVYQSIAGDRAAYASAYDNGNSFERFCEEHGVIISNLTIMPRVTYAYGINRDYSRLDQFDFAFSEFATVGMDAVYDTEICGTSLDRNPVVFGYQGRYYDYKAKHDEEHGELLDSQDMYTFSRSFDMYSADGAPKLNYEFVHCMPDLDMFVMNDPMEDVFRFDLRHSTAAERGLPSQSIYI